MRNLAANSDQNQNNHQPEKKLLSLGFIVVTTFDRLSFSAKFALRIRRLQVQLSPGAPTLFIRQTRADKIR